MKRKLLLLPVIALMLLATVLLNPIPSHAASEALYEFTYVNGATGGNVLIKNGVAYVSESLFNFSGLTQTWDKAHKRTEFRGWEKSFAVRIGSRTGLLDGRVVDLGGAPFLNKEELYIPARAVVAALGGHSLNWDAKTQRLTAAGLHDYASYSATYRGATYTAVRETGDLFVSFNKNARSKVGNLGNRLDLVNFAFEHTPGGLIVVSVRNNYGEPHIYMESSTFLLKNGVTIRQAHLSPSTNFYDPHIWSQGKLLLSDGKTARLIEDGTGKVLESIHLAKLMNADGIAAAPQYSVEALYADVALIRSSDTGTLTLLNRLTGEKTLLYKTFYTPEQQVSVETGAFHMTLFDGIQFTGREGNVFTFTCRPDSNSFERTFTLPAAQP